MHDIDRDSVLYKQLAKQRLASAHSDDSQHTQDSHAYPPHEHDHEEAGHDHTHDDQSYTDHLTDPHSHEHPDDDRFSRDRVFTHLHTHSHRFYHEHHHTHDPAHRTLLHKIFKDPVRDWFCVGLMVLMIVAGYSKWLPGHLSNGILVCAAVIGIFPLFKNALFTGIAKRRPTLEMLLSLLLIAGLFTGNFLEIALASLFLLLGSFMRVDFSWRKD